VAKKVQPLADAEKGSHVPQHARDTADKAHQTSRFKHTGYPYCRGGIPQALLKRLSMKLACRSVGLIALGQFFSDLDHPIKIGNAGYRRYYTPDILQASQCCLKNVSTLHKMIYSGRSTFSILLQPSSCLSPGY
jgi:hypothetical protein